MNVRIFAGWNPEDFTTSDKLFITLAFIVFILIITLPGLIIIKSSIKKKPIILDTSGKLNSPLSSSKHVINYKLLTLGILVFATPFLYFRFDTNIEDFKETLFFDGSLYSIDNKDTGKDYGLVQLDIESINAKTKRKYSITTDYENSKYSITKEYENCTRIVSPQIECFKFTNELYGDVYIDNEDNIDGGIKRYGTIIFQNDGSTIRIVTLWSLNTKCLDDAEKIYPEYKYADCYWDKYGDIVNDVKKDSKIVRAFQAW